MHIPKSPVRKTLKNPSAAITWGKNNLSDVVRQPVEKSVITPLFGRHLYDYNWDLAIILDACRYDLGERIAAAHSIELDKPEKAYSVGSMSSEWIHRTFTNASAEELSNTTYISANVFTDKVPDAVETERVWKTGWDEELGTVPPRVVTNKTIELMRANPDRRYIAHYMQPHFPPLEETKNDFGEIAPTEGAPWEGRNGGWEDVRAGNMKSETATQAYESNPSPVLDEVELLLSNVDAGPVIVTADHGNYLGEKGRWGHPKGHIHSAVRHVPWWTTSATDEKTHTPNIESGTGETSKIEKLEALGYR